MRSQLLTRRTRSLVKTQSIHHRALLSSTHALRYPRKDPSGSPQTAPRLSKRASSSATPSADSDAPTPSALPGPEEPPDDAEDKPKRRTRTSTSSKDVDPSPPLPKGLEILWTPGSDPADPLSSPHTHALPPPEILDEIVHNFHITLHPRTQHGATYAPTSGPLVEPTFALYSPIEGGDIYVDETVRELARRTGADVVIIDAVQLAAGASGQFGKAASVLHLPNNPLHLSSSSAPPTRSNARPAPVYDDDDWDDSPSFMMPSRMTLQVLTPVLSRPGRPVLTPAPRNGSMAKLKQFFDDLINVTAESNASERSSDTSPPPPARRPRIVYIRDFATLAPSSSIWYPALLAAVRQRRQGPILRPSSPVVNPTTIMFGITPSIIPPLSTTSSTGPGQQGLMNMLMSRHGASSTGSVANKPHKSEYGEDSASDKARERRMMARLKRWARGDATSQDLPRLTAGEDTEDPNQPKGKPDIVIVGGPEGMGGLPSMIGSTLSGMSPSSFGRTRSDSNNPDASTRFFRTSLVVPNVRTPSLERATRMARRREINELTTRMAVAAVGGELGKMEPIEELEENLEQPAAKDKEQRMWEEWGKVVEPWSIVRRIADRAVGSVIAEQGGPVQSLEPTPIPWSTIYEAWAMDRTAQDLWKSVLTETPGKVLREYDEEDEGKNADDEDGSSADEVIERVKRDPDLDQHEARLLGSIVDTTSLTTTFSQVHLPEHTIDAVRTIVSLPLLFPMAFQHGLLKEHSMTGCLLFGPPGTGKTLVVKALAKEAGCRMLAIKPSDVMDMYVGEGEKLVRAVFSLARKLSPCVVFIDELDALFGARVSRESGGGMAHRGVITEFMQEMDGLRSSKDDNVIVIGATNRPFDLDDAVLRRLPRRLLVDLPGEKERQEILKILIRDETLSPDIDLKKLAKQTETFSGSDLKHLCVAAVLDAVKERVNVPWRPSSSGSPSPPPVDEKQDQSGSGTDVTVADVSNPTSASDEPSAPLPSATTIAQDQVQDKTTVEAEVPLPSYSRTISWRNFEKALKEITPSASETLGSLAELRKWNEEFGEGRKQRKQMVWGKGKFGFTVVPVDEQGHGKVEATPTHAGLDRTVEPVVD